jgi:hypothetical protein
VAFYDRSRNKAGSGTTYASAATPSICGPPGLVASNCLDHRRRAAP